MTGLRKGLRRGLRGPDVRTGRFCFGLLRNRTAPVIVTITELGDPRGRRRRGETCCAVSCSAFCRAGGHAW